MNTDERLKQIGERAKQLKWQRTKEDLNATRLKTWKRITLRPKD